MGRTKYTSNHLERVRNCLKLGMSTREIATKLSMSKSTAARLAKNIPDGDYVKRTAGRPPSLSSRQFSLLTRGIRQRFYTSATEASAYWLRVHQLCLSRQTITRAFKRAKLKFRVKRKKPLLSKKHKECRLAFAKCYQYWTISQWKNVIWSDECKVQRIGKDFEKRYWAKEADYTIYIPTLQGGGHSVMIWGWMTWAGLGLIVFIDGTLNSEHYIELLEEAVPGSMVKWKQKQAIPPRHRIVFQHDNAPCHRSNETKQYLQEVALNVLPWPAMSPDLNPIEHVWCQLKRAISKEKYSIKNKAELKAAIAAFWENFPKESVQRLIKSMPERLQAVRSARGGHTRY
ncbi:related to Transposase [Sporisorium reilianum SRZ2]|uniref:Related to Transposase n=1 Tax=Sporisorium reilianum (strain SRZ2) TaxID=999809 RepID=E6ZT28_SPORE|nr:related to Transposase [Sporisorium reilianum SRZ2]